MAAALDRALHQSRLLQHPHMFRRAGKAHVERRRQFPDRQLPPGQMTKHRAPRRVRQRVKNSVEMRRVLNHVV